MVPRCFISTLKDKWFDFPPAMIIGEVTGQGGDQRDYVTTNFKGIRGRLIHWSLNYKPEIVVSLPKGRSLFGWLWVMCTNEKERERIYEKVFVDALLYVSFYHKYKELPTKIVAQRSTRDRMMALYSKDLTT